MKYRFTPDWIWPESPRSIVRIIALIFLSSCQIATTDVVGEDEEVLFLGGRVNWALDRDAKSFKNFETLERVERDGVAFSLDFRASRGDGESEQRLDGGEAILIGGQFFSGPETLSVDFELTRILVNARVGSPIWAGVSMEAFAGLEYDTMEVEVQALDGSPTGEGRHKTSSLGPGIGAAIVWQPLKLLRLSAEGRVGVGFSSEVDDVELSSIELGAHVYPSEIVGLFVGWQRLSYEAGPRHVFDSGVDLVLSGPVLSLAIRF